MNGGGGACLCGEGVWGSVGCACRRWGPGEGTFMPAGAAKHLVTRARLSPSGPCLLLLQVAYFDDDSGSD